MSAIIQENGDVKPISSLMEFDMWQAQKLLGREPKLNRSINCLNPNHADKNPSCLVRRWHYKCFTCGEHGDPIKAIQISKGLASRPEAVAYICQELQIPIPDSKETEAERKAIDHKIENVEAYWNWSQQDPETAYAYLEKRGISRETSKRYGVGYMKGLTIADFLKKLPENQREKVEQEFKTLGLISQNGNLLYADRIIYPIWRNGRIVNLIGRTRTSADIRPKYIFCAKTEPALPDTPWNLDEVRNETKVILVEGPVDGLTLIENGILNVIAIAGTQGLTKGKLQALKRSKIKEIVLVFDTDPNEAGQTALLKTGKLLFQARFVVKAIKLPFRKGNQKQDANSFFCDGATVEEFNALQVHDWFDLLLDSIVIQDSDSPIQRTEALKEVYKLVGKLPTKWHAHYQDLISRRFQGIKKGEIEANVKDFHARHKAAQNLTPYKIKEKLCAGQYVIADEGGSIWRYEGGVYQPWHSQEIGKAVIAIRKRDRDKQKDPTTFEIREVRGFIQDENFVPEEQFNPPGFLNTENRLVNLTTGLTENHRSDLYFTIQLPFAVADGAKCPVFKQTIKEILPFDQDRALLQMIFAYCLDRDISHHLAFLWLGDGRNGKSLVWRILEAMLSKNNVSHLSLSDMSERFRLVHLRHKLLNVTTEVKAGEKIDDSAFKALVAGESVRCEEKYQKSFEFEPYCKFIICANNMPRTRDFSDGFFDRLVILPFSQKFEGKRVDRKRFEKIVPAELPGIFSWAMQGLAKLRKTGEFIKTDSTQKALQDYKLEVDHVTQYIEDQISFNAKYSITAADLYSHYSWWTADNGYQRKSSVSFGKRFAKLLKDKRASVLCDRDHQGRYYAGCTTREKILGKGGTEELSKERSEPKKPGTVSQLSMHHGMKNND